MTMQNKQSGEAIVHDAVSDPVRLYGVPENVLNDKRLSNEQKLTILESWALDQRRLMESEDENMPQVHGGRPSAAVMYQSILAAERKLAN